MYQRKIVSIVLGSLILSSSTFAAAVKPSSFTCDISIAPDNGKEQEYKNVALREATTEIVPSEGSDGTYYPRPVTNIVVKEIEGTPYSFVVKYWKDFFVGKDPSALEFHGYQFQMSVGRYENGRFVESAKSDHTNVILDPLPKTLSLFLTGSEDRAGFYEMHCKLGK